MNDLYRSLKVKQLCDGFEVVVSSLIGNSLLHLKRENYKFTRKKAGNTKKTSYNVSVIWVAA